MKGIKTNKLIFYQQLPGSSNHDSPPALFTSFKLPKSSPPPFGASAMPSISQHSTGIAASLSSLSSMATTPLGHLAQLGREMNTSPPIPIASAASGISVSGSPSNSSPPSYPGPRSTPNLIPLTGVITNNPSQPQVCNSKYQYPFIVFSN